MDISTKVQERELGEFPISYNSSVAIMLLADKNKESPSLEAAKTKPEELWINIGTLFRNLENAIDPNIVEKLTTDILVRTLVEEVRLTVNYLRDIYQDKLKVVLYQSTYEFLHSKFPMSIIKKPSTQKQLIYDRLLTKTLKLIQPEITELIKSDFSIAEVPYVDYHVLRNLPNSEYKTLWVLTHHAVDLLGFKRAKEVKLLESSTARLRGKYEWNAKLTGKNLDKIPFNKLTLQIFGDRSNNFNSMGMKYKKILFALADEYKWNPTITEVKMKYNISAMKDTFSSKILLMMLK